jgi:hypothetical protein
MQALQMAWLAASPIARAKFLVQLTRADFDSAEPVAGELGGWLIPWGLLLQEPVGLIRTQKVRN